MWVIPLTIPPLFVSLFLALSVYFSAQPICSIFLACAAACKKMCLSKATWCQLLFTWPLAHLKQVSRCSFSQWNLWLIKLMLLTDLRFPLSAPICLISQSVWQWHNCNYQLFHHFPVTFFLWWDNLLSLKEIMISVAFGILWRQHVLSIWALFFEAGFFLYLGCNSAHFDKVVCSEKVMWVRCVRIDNLIKWKFRLLTTFPF